MQLRLLSRVNLLHYIVAAVRCPISTCLRHNRRNLLLSDEVRTLDDVDVQARRDMPCNVAMLHELSATTEVLLKEISNSQMARRPDYRNRIELLFFKNNISKCLCFLIW